MKKTSVIFADDQSISHCLVRHPWDRKLIISSRVVKVVQYLRGQIYILFMAGATSGRRIKTLMLYDIKSLIIGNTHEFGDFFVIFR